MKKVATSMMFAAGIGAAVYVGAYISERHREIKELGDYAALPYVHFYYDTWFRSLLPAVAAFAISAGMIWMISAFLDVRRALRAIRNFVDRHLTARTLVVVTIMLLVASWIYPPWIYGYSRGRASHGWFFVFDTTHEFAMSIDFGRLLLIDGILAVAGGLLAWAAFHSSKALRKAAHLAAYSLLVLPLLAGAGLLSGFLIQNIRKPSSKYDALLKAEPSTSSKKEDIFDKVAAVPNGFDPDKYLADKEAKLRILQETLDKRFQKGSSAAEALEGIRQARHLGYSDDEIYSYFDA